MASVKYYETAATLEFPQKASKRSAFHTFWLAAALSAPVSAEIFCACRKSAAFQALEDFFKEFAFFNLNALTLGLASRPSRASDVSLQT